MHGFGEFFWPNGKRYSGYYENDKKEGFGIYYWPDPLRVYLGFWKDGKQDGIGKYFNKDKSIKYGIWKNGENIHLFPNQEYAINNLLPKQLKHKKFFKFSIDDILQYLS